ncbi:MAG: DEAD/DEAH box helicase [Vulcanimicrobiota bacterium]
MLLAPTGSGKTLAAFLWCIDRLINQNQRKGTSVVYVSPLKALVYDIERNLRAPLAGVTRAAQLENPPTVAVRTGDTPQRERARQLKHPADILVTTPESLYLMLGSRQALNLTAVETVIIDEIHALAGTKRGAHLALTLERLARLGQGDPQRVGLSATVRPVDTVARYLGGDRPVTVVDTLEPPHIELEIIVPVEDMENPGPAPEPSGGSVLGQLLSQEQGSEGTASVWPSIYPRLLEQIQAHRSTIVFVNSRGLCERLALRLNELAGQELVRAHHGSVSHEKREEMEESLKSGQLKAIIATSSLELGIDMGAVDLVLLVESPGSVARGLQRVGRAGHQVGEISAGKIFPKFRGDLLECAVVANLMRQGALEPLRLPHNPLDVLAQQVVAMGATGPLKLEELEALLARTASFESLSREILLGLLDMLSGRFPSTDFGELRARLVWDRDTDTLTARPGAKQLALVNAGTIPDRGLYGVYIGHDGPRVGELDEEMVHEVRPGQNFLLGASSWRIQEITRDRVIVSPAPGEPGRMPFWHGDRPGRPIELGRAIGAFLGELGAKKRSAAESWLEEHTVLDVLARRNLLDYLDEQKSFTGVLPTDRRVIIERFRDELGDWRVCILTPFGARVHAPWALAIESVLSQQAGFDFQTLWTDDGIVLRLAETDELPRLDLLVPDPDLVEDLVLEQLANSAVFASHFRENAARALLLPRRRPGKRTPLWSQRLRAKNLQAVAMAHSNFPIVLETYRACLQDVFDMPSLVELLRMLSDRRIALEEVETESASPFARSLVFAYVAEYLYEGDNPLAERKAQALTLDRNLLRELLGQEELRDLLDSAVLDEVEAELQGLAADRQATSREALFDRLRRLGDLSLAEAEARCQGPARQWLGELEKERRVVRLHLGGEPRWVSLEDVALYRDALGAVPPGGLPAALLEPVSGALEQLLHRYARYHTPFLTREVSERYGVPAGQLDPALRLLVARKRLLWGDFRPLGSEREWCDPEILRLLRRRTLAKLRNQVAPVDALVLARFLQGWQGIGETLRLPEVVARLEGLPLPFSDLEKRILPARLPAYEGSQLDELGQLGALVWVGCGSLGRGDGKIALYRRDRIARLLAPPPPPEELEPLQAQLYGYLEQRGASFFYDLLQATGNPKAETLLEALWQLVWAGQVSNDSLVPLRHLGASARRKRGSTLMAGAGRWSLVRDLVRQPASDTERLMAWVQTFLDRYGVVTREAVTAEGFTGGFTPVYQTLKALEESGKVRRGYFVEGLAGAQFARTGTVDRLRDQRDEAGQPEVRWLAATDPANPYGALLPWPECQGRPRRAAGASLIMADGRPLLFLEKKGKKVLSFPAAHEPELMRASLETLHRFARSIRGRVWRLETIDGEPARKHALAGLLEQLGFRQDFLGLMLVAGA